MSIEECKKLNREIRKLKMESYSQRYNNSDSWYNNAVAKCLDLKEKELEQKKRSGGYSDEILLLDEIEFVTEAILDGAHITLIADEDFPLLNEYIKHPLYILQGCKIYLKEKGDFTFEDYKSIKDKYKQRMDSMSFYERNHGYIVLVGIFFVMVITLYFIIESRA